MQHDFFRFKCIQFIVYNLSKYICHYWASTIDLININSLHTVLNCIFTKFQKYISNFHTFIANIDCVTNTNFLIT